MKKNLLLLSLTLAFFTITQAQDFDKYTQLTSEAETFYTNKDYAKSSQKYAEAFNALAGKGFLQDRYKAAASFALSNQPDAAFAQLYVIAEKGKYKNFSEISSNADLKSLYNDERWKRLMDIVKANK